MPLALLLLLGVPSVGALAYSVVAKETRETTQELTRETGPNLVLLAGAALGLYAVFKVLEKSK